MGGKEILYTVACNQSVERGHNYIVRVGTRGENMVNNILI